MGTIKRTFANNLTGAGKLDATALDSNLPAANIANSSVTNVSALSSSLGQAISSVASDPPSPSLGDIWYNTTTGKLKNYGLQSSVFTSGGNLNQARSSNVGTGTLTAGLSVGGYGPGGTTSSTEEYDGSSWTTVTSVPGGYGNQLGGGGSQTSTVVFGGYQSDGTFTNRTEEYDGTNWSSGGSYPTNIRGADGGGTSNTAAFGGGGEIGNTGTNAFNFYNGSAWTSAPANPSANFNKFCGTQTATLAVENGPGATQEFDGSTWTTGNTSPTPTSGSTMFGVQTLAVLANGGISPAAEYDGSTWSNGAAPAIPGTTSRASNESGTTGFFAGGYTPPGRINTTEEYTVGTAGVLTVTTS